jgi:hypothetical protein
MTNTNKNIPTISLNKSDICSNTQHPIPPQELKPSSQNIPQTRCAIYLINRPRPCCCHNFSTALFLSRFYAVLFLLHFFYRDYSTVIFLSHFFFHTFFVAIFLPHFSYHTFIAALFLPYFPCHTFSVANFLYQ